MRARLLALAALAPVLAPACRSAPPAPGEEVARDARRGTEVEVCGRLFDVGVPVVLWHDPGGYDAYLEGPFFGDEGPEGKRFTEDRRLPEATLETVREQVELFVMHYDVCGTSRECFRVLQDLRKLSVHFLLDVDGAVYQTLDLEEQAWHARHANARSVGVEIAQVGAVPPERVADLDAWYAGEGDDVRLTFPERLAEGVPAGFDAGPARPGLFAGEIHGLPLLQRDFTAAQYDSLARLVGGLSKVLPGIALDVPRDAHGDLRLDAMTPEELEAFRGVVAHWHVTADKVDPGPAFDWDGFLEAARR